MIQVATEARAFTPHPKPAAMRLADAPEAANTVRFVAKTNRDASGKQTFYALSRDDDGNPRAVAFFRASIAAERRKAKAAGLDVEVVELEPVS